MIFLTAEIAVMNKMGIALAADSAVTIGGQKIYNSAIKLFSLSKYHPVGVMIYGNADFMGIPWETIVKVYRKELGTKKFNVLADYCNDFINFLSNNQSIFYETDEKSFLSWAIKSYFHEIKAEIIEQVSKRFKKNEPVSTEHTSKIVDKVIRKNYEDLRETDFLQGFSDEFIDDFKENYSELVYKLIGNVFDKIPINEELRLNLLEISAYIFSKEVFSDSHTGLVIAGFGEGEMYPSLKCYLIECKINGKLKYKIRNEQKIGETQASIIPFAQSEMVHTFIEGVDPFLDDFCMKYLERIFQSFPKIIIDTLISDEDELLKNNMLEKISKASTKLLDNYRNKINEYRNENHVDPVMDIVAVLPKDELAAMAESLVNLTSFKRKVTRAKETVGGPIDVAVISKGDGFIWIKRKHYFKPELNPMFFQNYMKGDENDGE
jgi:hypothetical protein